MLKKVIAFVFGLTILVGCSANSTIHTIDVASSVADLSGYRIDNDTLHQIDNATIHQIMDEKASAVIFFSRPSCPWCQLCMPEFVASVCEKGQDLPIYYYDVTTTNQQELDDLIAIANRFDNLLDNDENGNVRFFVPCALAIVNGKAKDMHVATVESHTDFNVPLNDAQKEELHNFYYDLFALVTSK